MCKNIDGRYRQTSTAIFFSGPDMNYVCIILVEKENIFVSLSSKVRNHISPLIIMFIPPSPLFFLLLLSHVIVIYSSPHLHSSGTFCVHFLLSSSRDDRQERDFISGCTNNPVSVKKRGSLRRQQHISPSLVVPREGEKGEYWKCQKTKEVDARKEESSSSP